MENASLLQTFAMDKDGRIRSIDEVPRGLACDCSCPVCGERVLARQGEVRLWHFAHASGAECAGGAEGALHLAAKQVLMESGGLMVPEIVVNASATLPDGRTGWGEVRRSEAWIDYQNPELEKSIGNVRPDIAVVIGHTFLFVEIAVTHFVDEAKQKEFELMGVPTIEIDLSDIKEEAWSWGVLKDIVIDGTQYKRWICMLDNKMLELEAKNKALIEASNKCDPNTTKVLLSNLPVVGSVVRSRFTIGFRIVDVHERPFGLTVWSPYDPEINERIKSLARYLGGRWQPRFKNWLFPMEARGELLSSLEKWAGRGPDVTAR